MCGDNGKDLGPGRELDQALEKLGTGIDRCTRALEKITRALDTVEGLLQNMKPGLVQLDNKIRKKKV